MDRTYSSLRHNLRRLFCALLALTMALELVPAAAGGAKAATMDNQYEDVMDALVDWGVMQGYSDGSLRPEGKLTRAEFVAMVNRAYGYSGAVETPFTDVEEGAWYENDIGVAYGMGYFHGTSETLASPNMNLTREQAMVLLARNMRMGETEGEITEFDDGHDFQDWSSGYVRSALDRGMIYGYDDGTFRPRQDITRGEMAVMLYNALGHVVNKAGDTVLGDVFGNVTINAPGATLRDTTIAGDLYISGGLGLGGVKLENVRVLGDIIVAGGGEAEGGGESVMLNNVEAKSLLVDNMAGQAISLSANGDTVIDQTVVRSDAHITDRTENGKGLLNITLEGNDLAPGNFGVAGNIGNLVNKAPESTLQVSKGTVQSLTVDEEAAGSGLSIDGNATVKQLNLDTAIDVTGQGSVESLQVSAAGCTIEMLPDKIDIRPGITAEIAGEEMDSETAALSSEEPKILAGYPQVKNIAPTKCTAVFSTNKPGTIYWAVSPIADGSISAEDLISTPDYGSKAISTGKVSVKAPETETLANITKLTKGGSFYLSAVMVDSRGNQSPVKVISFSTPDDTVPAFLSGYPRMSKITNNSAQMEVMVNKNCILYWAVLPQGSMAPTPEEFKANAVSGDVYGYGMEEVDKNTPYFFTVNQQALKELTTYDLYVWLTDADGNKSSSVQKITFTTVDGTPPVINSVMVTKVQATSLQLTANVNEDATLYWVAVNSKDKDKFPSAPIGSTSTGVTSESAIIQIVNGSGAAVVKSGKTNVKANKDTNFTISGLQAQTEYVIWYVAQDKAGNYSVFSQTATPGTPANFIVAKTLDNVAPTVRQDFSNQPDDTVNTPYPDTSIDIIFSEKVQAKDGTDFLTLYENWKKGDGTGAAEAKKQLLDALQKCIVLYDKSKPGKPLPVAVRTDPASTADWVLDYNNVEVLPNPENEDELIVRFPYSEDAAKSAVNLRSGTKYGFKLTGIYDTSGNLLKSTLPDFSTIDAQALLVEEEKEAFTLLDDKGNPIKDAEGKDMTAEFDSVFSMTPMSITKASGTDYWDMMLWADTTCDYDLYYKGPTDASWTKLGSASTDVDPGDTARGRCIWRNLCPDKKGDAKVANLNNNEKHMFGIFVTSFKQSPRADYTSWNGDLNVYASVVTGMGTGLDYLANKYPKRSEFSGILKDRDLTNITIAGNNMKELKLPIPFSDSSAPYFIKEYPKFDMVDETGTIAVSLNRAGTIYYAVAPVVKGIPTTDLENNIIDKYETEYIPYSDPAAPFYLRFDGTDKDGHEHQPNLLASDYLTEEQNKGKADCDKMFSFPVATPKTSEIKSPNFGNANVKTGRITVGNSDTQEIKLTGLQADTEYFAYFVLVGADSGKNTEHVILYKFKTTDVIKPVLDLKGLGSTVTLSSSIDADLYYVLINNTDAKLDTSLSVSFNSVVKPEYEHGKPDAWSNYEGADLKEKLDEYEQQFPGKKYEKFNVLDAMSIFDPVKKQTLFDLYATDNAKTDVMKYIQSATPNPNFSDVVETGSESKKANVAIKREYNDYDKYLKPPSKITYNKGYAFLAMGKGQSSSDEITSWSFRATYPIKVTDTTVPQIQHIELTGAGSGVKIDKDTGEVSVKGTLRIDFTRALYEIKLVGGKNVITPLCNWDPKEDTSPTPETGKSWGHYITANTYPEDAVIEATYGAKTDVPSAVSSVDFNISNFKFNEGPIKINIASSEATGCLGESSGNMYSSGTTITLQIVKESDGGQVIYKLMAEINPTNDLQGNHQQFALDNVFPATLAWTPVNLDEDKLTSVPKVKNVKFNMTPPSTPSGVFSGTVEFTFDKALHYKDYNGNPVQYIGKYPGVVTTDPDGSLYNISTKSSSTIIAINLVNISENTPQTITFRKSLICNDKGNQTSFGQPMTDDITLTFIIKGTGKNATIQINKDISNEWKSLDGFSIDHTGTIPVVS